MPIPEFQEVMLPLLLILGDNVEHLNHKITEKISEKFKLTDEEKNRKLISNGDVTLIMNRIHWAKLYLERAKLIESTHHGSMKITPRGEELLWSKPDKITVEALKKYPEVSEWLQGSPKVATVKSEGSTEKEEVSALNQIDSYYKTLIQRLTTNMVEKLKKISSVMFEKLVMDMLVSLGHNESSIENAMYENKQSGEPDIIIRIKENIAGIDEILYIEAKKTDKPIARSELDRFLLKMKEIGANSGIFITTSSFTQESVEYSKKLNNLVELMDGYTLAQLMIYYDMGVSMVTSYDIKAIDSDYFRDEL